MKSRHYPVYLVALVLVFIVSFALLALFPGKSIVTKQIWDAFVWFLNALLCFAVLTILCLGPFFLGWLFRYHAIPAIDEWVAPRFDMSGWGILFLCFITGPIIFFVWPHLVMLSAHIHWVDLFFRFFGWPGGYETPPLFWGLFAVLATWVTEIIASFGE